MINARNVLDTGNKELKCVASYGNTLVEYATDSFVAEINKNQWDQFTRGSNQIPQGYYQINYNNTKTFYVVGSQARKFVNVYTKPKGADRYRARYYDAAVCALSYETLPSSKITPMLLRPPKDYPFDKTMVNLIPESVEVIGAKGTKRFDFSVDRIYVTDEPIGSLTYCMFTQEGVELKSNPFKNKRVLFIDIGGFTTDTGILTKYGEVEIASLDSVNTGIWDVIEGLDKAMRVEWPEKFLSVQEIETSRIGDAIVSGIFKYGKTELNCKHLVDSIINPVVNDIINAIVKAGGVINFDVILLTGGGSVLLGDYLKRAMPDAEFHEAAKPNIIKMANAFGGQKLFKLYKQLGIAGYSQGA